jgi:hypothetical protein
VVFALNWLHWDPSSAVDNQRPGAPSGKRAVVDQRQKPGSYLAVNRRKHRRED